MTRIRYFAAAAEAAGTDLEHVDAGTLGELLDDVRARHGADLARVLARCSLLIDGTRATDASTPLTDGGTVDVLPPFAGG